MTKPEREGSNNDMREPRPLGVIGILLGFLDRKFGHFNRLVQNIIGVGIFLLVAIYFLNGFVLPTFVRGHLYLVESATAGKRQVSGYVVELKNETMTTNIWGNWMLPVYRSGIPGKVKIQIYDSDNNFVDRFSFTGPWPVWTVLFPMEYDLEIHSYETQGKRIKVSHRLLGESFILTLLRQAEWAPSAFAQSSSTPLAQPPQTPGIQTSETSKPLLLLPSLGEAFYQKLWPAYGIEIRSITIGRFPSIWRSNGKVYISLTVNDKPFEDRNLLSQSKSSPSLAWASWASTLTYKKSFQPLRFPVKSIRESWIPVRSGQTERFEDLVGNITEAVELISSTDLIKWGELKGVTISVKPKGRMVLSLWADNDVPLGSFDITKDVENPNRAISLESSDRDQGTRVEVSFRLGWVGSISPTPTEKPSKE